MVTLSFRWHLGFGVGFSVAVSVGEGKVTGVSSKGLQIPKLARTFLRLLFPVVVSAI